ncbi:hypothetical protein EBT31_06200 [bacterium]|nr:hypothetical protein [bacterium]
MTPEELSVALDAMEPILPLMRQKDRSFQNVIDFLAYAMTSPRSHLRTPEGREYLRRVYLSGSIESPQKYRTTLVASTQIDLPMTGGNARRRFAYHRLSANIRPSYGRILAMAGFLDEPWEEHDPVPNVTLNNYVQALADLLRKYVGFYGIELEHVSLGADIIDEGGLAAVRFAPRKDGREYLHAFRLGTWLSFAYRKGQHVVYEEGTMYRLPYFREFTAVNRAVDAILDLTGAAGGGRWPVDVNDAGATIMSDVFGRNMGYILPDTFLKPATNDCEEVAVSPVLDDPENYAEMDARATLELNERPTMSDLFNKFAQKERVEDAPDTKV